nr:protein kinase, ATP binding site-containing protein [Tanacetum cinerariifolium]
MAAAVPVFVSGGVNPPVMMAVYLRLSSLDLIKLHLIWGFLLMAESVIDSNWDLWNGSTKGMFVPFVDLDPVYRQTGIHNKESDVYSYGVVLFEILTGRLPGKRMCIGDKEPLNLLSLVRRYYAEKPDKFLDPQIRDEIDARSLETFREIAYKCISFNVKDRPSWNEIIKKLEEALNFQDEVSTSCQALKVLSLSCDSCDSKG